jgi:hypothetical protein
VIHRQATSSVVRFHSILVIYVRLFVAPTNSLIHSIRSSQPVSSYLDASHSFEHPLFDHLYQCTINFVVIYREYLFDRQAKHIQSRRHVDKSSTIKLVSFVIEKGSAYVKNIFHVLDSRTFVVHCIFIHTFLRHKSKYI